MNLIELDRSLRQLRLGGMAAVLETRLHQAQAEAMAPSDFMRATNRLRPLRKAGACRRSTLRVWPIVENFCILTAQGGPPWNQTNRRSTRRFWRCCA